MKLGSLGHHRVELPRLPDAGKSSLPRTNSDSAPFQSQDLTAASRHQWSMSLPPGKVLLSSSCASHRPKSGGPLAPLAREGAGDVAPGDQPWPVEAQLEVARLRREMEEQHAMVQQAMQRAQQAEERNQALADELSDLRAADAARKEETAAAAQRARLRAGCGAAGIVCAAENAGLQSVFSAWRTAAAERKAGSLLQTRLFAEEANRGAALRAQKIDLDIRYMEAEVRHRAATHKLKADLAEAEVRNADQLAKLEDKAAQQLAAAEADFMTALREATGSRSKPGEGGDAEEGAEQQSSAEADGSGEGVGSGSRSGQADARLVQALASMRRRADVQYRELEEQSAAVIQAERERSERQQAQLDRRHQEALQAARDAGERRLQAAEARHTEELYLLQQVSIDDVLPCEDLEISLDDVLPQEEVEREEEDHESDRACS